MKRLTFSLIMLIAVTGVYAQQTIKSEAVSRFNTISLSGNMTTTLIKSEVSRVDITLSEDADIAKFKWGISNGTLSVTLRSSQGGKGHAEVKIYYADSLSNVSVSGGELKTNEPITADILRVSASGGAKVTADLEVFDLELEVTGNSVAQYTGESKYMSLRATDKSKVDTRELECMSVVVESATGAEVYVTTLERLVANAKTTSTIFYKGTPRIFKNITSKMNAGMMGSSVLNIGD